jgi:hypothetical protein
VLLSLQLELQCSGVLEMQSLYQTEINAFLFTIYSLLYAKKAFAEYAVALNRSQTYNATT